MQYEGIEIHWYGHDSFFIVGDGRKVWIDPFELSDGVPKGDLVLITHEHFDHFSEVDLRRVLSSEAVVVTPFEATVDRIETKRIAVGEIKEFVGIKVQAVYAYNINKFREPGEPFHPKATEWVGYLLHFKTCTLYHMGDTDHIPELGRLKVDVALVPVSGTYVMTAVEAVDAVNELQPKLAIPMHYGSVVGSDDDAYYLKANSQVPVEILQREF